MQAPCTLDEAPKVGIYRDQHALLGGGPLQDDAVTRVRRIRADFGHVVTLLAEPVSQSPSRTAINEELHVRVSSIASSESFAMTA